MKNFNKFKLSFLACALVANFAFANGAMDVYKGEGCGCCGFWAEIMQKNGFEVKEHYVPDVVALKFDHKVPLDLSSCHTAVIGGYVVEGHVPAEDVKDLLNKQPSDVVGIAVPGMPLGSPGMEQGGIVEDYDVIAFKKDGSYEIFSTYKNGKRFK